MLLFHLREGVRDERVVAFPPRRALPVDPTGRNDRVARGPDRRRANERRKSLCRSQNVFALDREKLAPRQRQPLEQGDANTIREAPSTDADVATVIHDERRERAQATFVTWRGRRTPITAVEPGEPVGRSVELHNGHAADARSPRRWAQDALSDVSLGAIELPAVEALAQQGQDVLGLWVAPEHRLREHELTVEVNVEDAALSGHDLERLDLVLHLLENPHRQTDGVRQRASGDAVLDPDAMSFGHGCIQSVPPPVPRGRFATGNDTNPVSEQLSATCGLSV